MGHTSARSYISWKVSAPAGISTQGCLLFTYICTWGFNHDVVELHLKLTQVLHLKVTHLEEPEYGSSVLGFSSFCLLGFLRRAVFEAVAIVAGFNDVAVMSQPVE